MKWFYPAALLIVAGMVLSPYLLLRGEAERFDVDRIVVGWDENDQPIYKDDPIILFDTYGAEIKSIDPAVIGDVAGASMMSKCYESLLQYHFLKRPASTETLVPQLAAELPQVSEDRLTYTFKIRKDVLFQRNRCFGMENGRPKTRPIRAQDFILAFKRIADANIPSQLSWSLIRHRIEGLDEYRKKTEEYEKEDFSRYDLEVSGLQAPDNHTLVIKLKEPYPQFQMVLAMNSYAPIAREVVDTYLVDQEPVLTELRKPEMVVGTGPYLLDTWQAKNMMMFVRNPDFRLERYPTEGEPAHGDYPGDRALGLLDDAGKRVPFIDVLKFKYTKQSYPGWMMFLSKRKDITGIPKETFDFVVTPGKELSKSWEDQNIEMQTYTRPTIFWAVFNMEDPVLGASKSLRQAICLAFDVENYIRVLYNGRGQRAVNYVPSNFPSHPIAGPGPYYIKQTDENRRELLARAKKKLEDARKELAQAGQLTSDGRIPPIELEMGSGGRSVTIADFFKQQFKKVDLELKTNFNDWDTLQKKVDNKAAQMYMMGWHADYPDAENFMQLFYGPNIKTGTNNANYSDPQFDQWYEQARTMPDSPERMELYVKMNRKLCEDVPALLLAEDVTYILYYEWIKNIKPHPVGYGYTRFRKIDNDLRKRLGGRTH